MHGRLSESPITINNGCARAFAFDRGSLRWSPPSRLYKVVIISDPNHPMRIDACKVALYERMRYARGNILRGAPGSEDALA
jgi:hypothetical protein